MIWRGSTYSTGSEMTVSLDAVRKAMAQVTMIPLRFLAQPFRLRRATESAYLMEAGFQATRQLLMTTLVDDVDSFWMAMRIRNQVSMIHNRSVRGRRFRRKLRSLRRAVAWL